MQNNHSIITPERARIICEMAGVCFSEGTGPAYSELVRFVFSLYPELQEEYAWLGIRAPRHINVSAQDGPGTTDG